jgi:tetratricopeptide (TPR) repeat protein
LVKHGTDNIDAYNAYLKGRHFEQQRGEGLQRAIACFEEAIQKDPSYAQPYAGLAEIFGAQGAYGYIPSSVAYSKAREAAERAIAMDEELADGHCSIAVTEMYFGWDWANAVRELERALELNPGLALPHAWLALVHVYQQRDEEAVSSATRAIELDPAAPLIRTRAALTHFLLGQYSEAIEKTQSALELEPTSVPALWIQGIAWSHLGEHTMAVTQTNRAVVYSGDNPSLLALLSLTHARAGQSDEAWSIVRQLEERSRAAYVSPTSLAVAYAALNDLDSAFGWLRAGIAERNTFCVHIASWPDFDHLRADPRWREMAPPELVDLRPPSSTIA